jgi:hypothetical protein
MAANLTYKGLEVMPFKSEKQRKYLFKNKPNVAKKFAKDSKKKTHKMPDGTVMKGAKHRG